MQHLTFPQLLCSMSLWIITLLYYSKSLYSRKFAMQERYFFFCIAVIVFSTFAYANLDFFHYKESYDLIIQYKYNGGNYLLWLEDIGYAEDPKYIIAVENVLRGL